MTTPVTEPKKKYMTGVYSDLHFVCELTTDREENIYKCIPKHSKGNGTDMTFFATNPKAKFFDTLEEALGNKKKHNSFQAGIREEEILTGKRDRNGRWTPEY